MTESESSPSASPGSSSEKGKPCEQCGNAIPPEAPHGLCPSCLLSGADSQTNPDHPAPLRQPDAVPKLEEVQKAFPHLQVLEPIGHGGMGAVFKARQPKLERLVALKILPQHLASNPEFAERFAREGRILAKLTHPNIITVYDIGEESGFLFILMEFVEGINLRQAIRSQSIPSEKALAIVPTICEALQYAHDEGVLHRDIKPENILLNTKGNVKIADFGIAKMMNEEESGRGLTMSGAAPGTPHYMAPEQIESPNTVDHRADIYSLGVVFYELLTGELPIGRFPAPSSKSNKVNPEIDEVVFKSLEKERNLRQQSAAEMKTQVQGVATMPAQELAADTAPVFRSPTPTPSSPSTSPVDSEAPTKIRKEPTGVLGIVAAVVLALLVLGIGGIAGILGVTYLSQEKMAVSESRRAQLEAIQATVDQLAHQRQQLDAELEVAQTIPDPERSNRIRQMIVQVDDELDQRLQHDREVRNESDSISHRRSYGRLNLVLAGLLVGLGIPGGIIGWIALALGRKHGAGARAVSAATLAALFAPLLLINGVLFWALHLAAATALPGQMSTPAFSAFVGITGIFVFLLLDLWLISRIWNWAHGNKASAPPLFTSSPRLKTIGTCFLLLACVAAPASALFEPSKLLFVAVVLLGLLLMIVGIALLTKSPDRNGGAAPIAIVALVMVSFVWASVLASIPPKQLPVAAAESVYEVELDPNR